MKKTLIISYNYPPVIGGIETYAYELIKYFKNNHSDQYSFIYNKKKKPLSGILRGTSFIFFIVKTLVHISNKRYPAVHITNSNLWFIGYVYSKLNKDSKIFLNLWGLELVYSKKKGLLPKFYNYFLPIKFLGNLDSFEFLVSSKASYELARCNGFRDYKLHSIPLGTNKFNTSTLNSSTEKYIFFSGRITPRKGLSWFVQNVLVEFPDLKLKFCGPIIDKKEFSKIMDSNRVEYMGVVSDDTLLKLRYESSAVVIPNTKDKNDPDFEAFCFVTIESVASKSIVLASDYQGLSDSLLNGKLGYLANPSDIKSWVKQLNKILNLSDDERANVINSRLALLEKTFIWEKIFIQTYNLHCNEY